MFADARKWVVMVERGFGWKEQYTFWDYGVAVNFAQMAVLSGDAVVATVGFYRSSRFLPFLPARFVGVASFSRAMSFAEGAELEVEE